jgi:protocatechuate 3,4-dioxygenase alpha subunit
MAERTPSQTVGPFFHEALRWAEGGKLAPDAPGPRAALAGRIRDGSGAPVADAMVEAWHAGARALGRVETGADGGFRFEFPLPPGPLAALDIAIFARGLLKAVRTRVYLAPESVVRTDPLLAPLQSSPRLKTLVATPRSSNEFEWDVRLQGEGETVFFAP